MTGNNRLARFDLRQRNLPAPVLGIVAPVLGLVYIIVLPFIGLVTLIFLGAILAKDSLVATWRKVIHSTVAI